MAQASLTVENAAASVVRTGFNAAIGALASSNSGPTAPPNPVGGQLWLDTSVSPGVLRMRNAANNAWVVIPTDAENPFLSEPLAKPFPIWDHIPGAPIPDNSGTAKFIRLTAAQSGVGGYNEGLLTDEQVSGSAPLVEADAEIVTGPLAGQRVPLINTEMSFIRPGTDSGALQFDQMQRITGSFKGGRAGGEEGVGAFSVLAYQSNNISGSSSSTFYSFNSANSPDARTSDTTEGETRPKNRQATFYMRIA